MRNYVSVRIFLSALCLFLLTLLCSCSSLPEIPENISADPKYDQSSVHIIAESSDDFADLENYVNLASVDFTGSNCYELIRDYIENHPNVNVTYSVILESSTTELSISPDADSVTLADGDLLHQLSEAAQFLENLKTVTISDPFFTKDDLLTFASAYPNVQFLFIFPDEIGTVDYLSESLDLSGLKSNDVFTVSQFLNKMPKLKDVKLTSDEGANLISLDELKILQAACPDVLFEYRFNSFGVEVSTLDEKVEYYWAEIYNEGLEQIRDMMPCMKQLKEIFFQYCEIDYDLLAKFREDYPEVNIVWRVDFGPYSCRTDTERIFANGSLNSDMCYNLKYCNKVKYIDLGHNDGITTIEFTRYMPELEVGIFAVTSLWDVSPLAECSKLRYLEIFTTNVYDISALSSCTALEHLNISCLFSLSDISPIYSLKSLKRMWCTMNNISYDQQSEIQEMLPDCECCFMYVEPTGNHWRYDAEGNRVQAYEEISQIFGYDNFRDNISWW